MTSEHKKLWKEIDRILLEDWDPIGIYGEGPDDEYIGYSPHILMLKLNGADSETIAAKLDEYVVKNIGLSGNMEHCREIADKIIALKF